MAEYTLEQLEAALKVAQKANRRSDARRISKMIEQKRPKKGPLTAMQRARGALDAFSRGVTLGALDELQGLVAGGVNVAMGRDFSEGYERAAKKSLERAEEFREDVGPVAYVPEIAGSIVPGLLAAPIAGASRLGQAGVLAGEGALAGALSAEGGLEERGKGALIGAGVGTVLGGAGAALPRTTQAAKELMGEGVKGFISPKIRLTPGQMVGGVPGFTEGLLSKMATGYLSGVPQAISKSYEDFSKSFVQESLKGIGYKSPKGMQVRDVIDDANKFTRSKFKEATKNASFTKDSVDSIETSVLQRVYDQDYLEEMGLDLEGSDLLLAAVDRLALNRMKKGSLTGKELADILSGIGSEATAKMKGTPAERNIGMALFDIQSDIINAMPAGKASQELLDARKAYRAMIAVNKAGRGRAKDAFSPVQAESALEAVYKGSAKETPQGKLARTAKQAMGSGSVPIEGQASGLGGALGLSKIAEFLGLGYAGLQTGGTALSPLLGGNIVYRTGPFGRNVGRLLVNAPAVLAKTPTMAPQTSGLLAEQATQEAE